jgi:hypothetical protein
VTSAEDHIAQGCNLVAGSPVEGIAEGDLACIAFEDNRKQRLPLLAYLLHRILELGSLGSPVLELEIYRNQDLQEKGQ